MKGYRIREEMNGTAEPPGKTWFWELEAGVIEADRCIQCGTCVAVCPSNSIGIGEDTFLPELVKMCTGCSLCWDFCPRGGLRYESAWPPSTPMADEAPVNFVERPDAADPYWKITGGPPGDGLGAVLQSYAARAGSRSDFVQDGGVVTALLLAALAGGEIDGALVTKPSSDPAEPWKGLSHLATTAKEIVDAAGSYYNQTMALAELDLSKYDLPPNPRIAVVGTPCEIQGIRAMQSRRWETGVHRVDAVVLTIALLCTKSFDYQGLMLRLLRDDLDPGDPCHAVASVGDGGSPSRRRCPDHRLVVYQELRLPGSDAAPAARRPGHRHRSGQQGRRDPRPDDRGVPRR